MGKEDLGIYMYLRKNSRKLLKIKFSDFTEKVDWYILFLLTTYSDSERGG